MVFNPLFDLKPTQSSNGMHEYERPIPDTGVFAQVTRLNPSPGSKVTDPHDGWWSVLLTVGAPGGLVLFEERNFGVLVDYCVTHERVAKIAFELLGKE